MTDRTRVIHIHDMKNNPDAFYIGRAMPRQRMKASEFANRFHVKEYGRDGAIDRYRAWLLEGEGRRRLHLLPVLRNRPLACWCRHEGEPVTDENACHGDVIVGLLERYTDDELRAMAVTE